MDTQQSTQQQQSLGSKIVDTVFNIVLIVGLVVVVLFIANAILHKFFKFHLLTENWYVFSKRASSFIVRDLPINAVVN